VGGDDKLYWPGLIVEGGLAVKVNALLHISREIELVSLQSSQSRYSNRTVITGNHLPILLNQPGD